ncbi:MAG: enoyl-CoA hydratase [Bradymonadia bacterium]|jgi:enoyl-CoA hydratase
MSFENIRYEFADGIATITFDRQAALNALNAATMVELGRAITQAEEEDAGAIILTGAGKAFVAGADIAAMTGMSTRDASRFAALGNNLFRRIEQLPIPVIAAVNGFALGGGCEVAMACDFIYASEKAKFGQPEVGLGLIPGFGGTQRLPLKLGYGMAMELLMSGRVIRADEALRIGLVNRVVAPEELIEATRATAKEIMAKGPVSVQVTKRLVQLAGDVGLDAGLKEEIGAFGAIFATQDSKEGTTAFIEKRKPNFKGA